MFAIISKVFNFETSIKDDVMKGLKVSRTDELTTTENPFRLRLTANPGYLINENSKNLLSNIFQVVVKLAINAKPTTSQSAISELELESITTLPQDIDETK
jgi:hypothetical protein